VIARDRHFFRCIIFLSPLVSGDYIDFNFCIFSLAYQLRRDSAYGFRAFKKKQFSGNLKDIKDMTALSVESASKIQMDYMKLLVTQLQNQNPLDPLDNQQMASQLAQFSQLQQLEGMNNSFSEVLSLTNRNYANSLLGKSVTFYQKDTSTGALSLCAGKVESVLNNPETGEMVLKAVSGTGEELQQYFVVLNSVIKVEE